MTLAEVIKLEIARWFETYPLCDYVTGAVKSVSPVQILVNKLILEQDDVIILDHVKAEIVQDAELVLLKVNKGQRYIALGAAKKDGGGA